MSQNLHGYEDLIRILCIGDSFTYLGSTTEGYVGMLEEILNKNENRYHFQTDMYAYASLGIAEMSQQLDHVIEESRPDIVVMMLGINDKMLNFDGDSQTLIRRLLNAIRKQNTFKLLVALLQDFSGANHDMFGRIFHRTPVKVKVNQNSRSLLSETPVMTAAWQLFHEQRYGELSGVLRKMVEKDPRDYRALTLTAKLLIRNGQYHAAEDLVEAAYLLTPWSDKFYKEQVFDDLSKIQILKKEHAALQELILEWVEHYPEDADEKGIQMKQLSQVLGDARGWETYYRFQIRYDLGQYDPYLNLLVLYSESDQFPEENIRSIYQDAVKTFPHIAGFHELYARYLMRQGHFSDALAIVEKGLSAESVNWYTAEALMVMKTALLQDLGRPEDAERVRNLIDSQLERRKQSLDKIKGTLFRHDITFVAMQYPRLPVEDLMHSFSDPEGIYFVDNEDTFNDAVEKEGYFQYFIDHRGPTFGHLSQKGKSLITQNVARVILEEVIKRVRRDQE